MSNEFAEKIISTLESQKRINNGIAARIDIISAMQQLNDSRVSDSERRITELEDLVAELQRYNDTAEDYAQEQREHNE